MSPWRQSDKVSPEIFFIFHLFSLYIGTTYVKIVQGRRFSYWFTKIRAETTEKEIFSAREPCCFVID
jgi:hypothetical protein